MWDHHRTQPATLWRRSSISDYGDVEFSSPEPIKVRWEEKLVETFSSDGSSSTGKGVVLLGTDVKEGDFLVLGSSTSSTPTDEASRVLEFRKVRTVDGQRVSRQAVVL